MNGGVEAADYWSVWKSLALLCNRLLLPHPRVALKEA